MRFYEVLVADSRYRGAEPLTYSSEEVLAPLSVVTVPLRGRPVTGFVLKEADKPEFAVKPIAAQVSNRPVPRHCLELAKWISAYYMVSPGEALRQFAPNRPAIRSIKQPDRPGPANHVIQLELASPLTNDQKRAIKEIKTSQSTTVLLHGQTGSGKTRVYLELAKESLKTGTSVILLTPEISLTSQLAAAAKAYLQTEPVVLHSQLTAAKRKQIWKKFLEAKEPLVVVGPRSALFAPVANIGLIVLDEAHEPAYKQEQSPRYSALRTASQLGTITGAKVVFGTATPNTADYYLAKQHAAVVKMTQMALKARPDEVITEVVDLKDQANFGTDRHLSKQLIEAVNDTLSSGKQAMIYLNRRGSARVILCDNCGWRHLCPNCDVSLVYHADSHLARCHICGFGEPPPVQCPNCGNTDIIFKVIGTKALAEKVQKLFPDKVVRRFDSDSSAGESLHELYEELLTGKADIIVGTQLLAKGLDLPKLGLVGIISAESSLTLPDYTAEERTFQLLYQVIGRVGRGHGNGRVIIQTYEPTSPVIKAAVKRDYEPFYERVLAERRAYRFPPFAYLMKLTVRRTTVKGAQEAATRLKSLFQEDFLEKGRRIEIIGPTPSFYARRGRYFYYQLVAKSKDRDNLLALAKLVPADWQIDLDPVDLL